jgi:hypothetical protein
VPPEFIELTAVATRNNAALVRGGGVDPDQIRDLMSYAEAYSPVADELEALARFVRHSVATAKNKGGQRRPDHLRRGAARGQASGDGRSRSAGRRHAPGPRTGQAEVEVAAGPAGDDDANDSVIPSLQ